MHLFHPNNYSILARSLCCGPEQTSDFEVAVTLSEVAWRQKMVVQLRRGLERVRKREQDLTGARKTLLGRPMQHRRQFRIWKGHNEGNFLAGFEPRQLESWTYM